MMLAELLSWAVDKARFQQIDDYSDFCEAYLDFIRDGLQAVVVSRNETYYRFYQYRQDGNYSFTRPINANLMLSQADFSAARADFGNILCHIREIADDPIARARLNRYVYTCQQSIGAALDALPSGRSNQARKINGDLFEQYIRLLLERIGIPVRDGVVSVPLTVDGEEISMIYQHDVIIETNQQVRAIGSVKTSSKDRLDKIFIDKFLFNRLTETDTPHFAVFLNDVQRSGREPRFGVNTTFLTGHFKGYTVKLNPLDGVYYCDLRPNMREDAWLRGHIRSLDCLLVEDVWRFI